VGRAMGAEERTAGRLRRDAVEQVHKSRGIVKGRWPQPYTAGIGEMEWLSHQSLHYGCSSRVQRTRGILGAFGSGSETATSGCSSRMAASIFGKLTDPS